MSKIIQVVNLMISNPHNIGKTFAKGQDEYYFKYKGKQAESKWSIRMFTDEQDTAQYILQIYPGDQTLDALATIGEADRTNVPTVTYSTYELRTREARESFSELYRLVKERHYNVDATLDDIIEGGEENP